MKYLTLGTAFLFTSLSVSAQTGTPLYTLQEKIERIEHDLILVQQRVYKGPQAEEKASGSKLNADQADDLLSRLTAQEQVINELTERVEQLTHEVQQTSNQLKKINADIDVRFKLLEENKSSENKNELQDKKTTDKSITTPQEQYEAAYQLLREGKHVKAETAFLAFIKDNPKHDLAGNANYWLGETYYARGQYEQAAPIFAEGFTTYKNNSKAPDNLLKLGLTMHKLGKKEEACTAFSTLADEFPKANQNIKNRAKDEAKKLSCQ